jgi:hypothetical protein
MLKFLLCRASALALLVALVSGPFLKAQSVPLLAIGDLGKGAAALDGPWQFHTGDDPSFASPSLDDATGYGGWSQITTDKTWAQQGHLGYTGFAWYRKHVSLSPAPGTSGNFSLQLPLFESIAEVYWNGKLVNSTGKMPPYPSWPAYGCSCSSLARTVELGKVRDGVLAIRIWMRPLMAIDGKFDGGFTKPIFVGSPEAIADREKAAAFDFLRSMEYNYALQCMSALVMVFSLIAWARDRSQGALLWLALYCASQVTATLVELAGPVFTFGQRSVAFGTAACMSSVATWFLLLHLLRLENMPRLVRCIRILACVEFVAVVLDSTFFLPIFDLGNSSVAHNILLADKVLATIFTVLILVPIVLLAAMFRNKQRLDASRWAVAGFAIVVQLILVLGLGLQMASSVFHGLNPGFLWKTLFTIAGTPIYLETLASTGFFVSIIYAALRYSREALRRNEAMEQELRSAQALQQVLIPQSLPSMPGYALTSSYKPAREVGGDFFQVIPADSGASIVVIGDVSGKGLGAAMAVSLIVGTVRTLARAHARPARILAGLNQELHGRLHGGFVTCLILYLDAEGNCTMASAGHPAPLLNGAEILLPGELPLGLVPEARYHENSITLVDEDHLVLYSDGLLEARSAGGEVLGFERLADLASHRLTADEALRAAVEFGQEDDITVLTLTRTAIPNVVRTAGDPILVPA